MELVAQQEAAAAGEEEGEECPLFMTALPSKAAFDNNTAIGALCTLVDDGTEPDVEGATHDESKAEGEQSIPTARDVAQSGGSGLVSRRVTEKKNARRHNSKPYGQKRRRARVTVGEAQVYMSLMASCLPD